MLEKIREFKKDTPYKLKKLLSKYLGVSLAGTRYIFGRFEEKPQMPFVGVWHYCRGCDWFGFVDLFDPWSHSSRSYCDNCGTVRQYGANDVVPGLSAAYLQICGEIARDRHPSSGRRKTWEFFKLEFFGLDADSIPEHRDNKTLAELESRSIIYTLMSM
jgi:hypothetical protein